MAKKIIVGLGNPGKKYYKTRHNAGVIFVESVFSKPSWPELSWSDRGDFFIAEKVLSHRDVLVECLLVFPQTFMNNSGIPLKQFASKKGVALKDIIVCHDELDLPLGDVRYKFGGGEAGHNGLKSISQCFGSRDYSRIRIGIGKPGQRVLPDVHESTEKFQESDSRNKMFTNEMSAVEMSTVKMSTVDWVLSDFSKPEREKLETVFKKGEEILLNAVIG